MRRLGFAPDGVDDIVQETFLVVSSKLDQVLPGRERAFLYSVARRVAAGTRRKDARAWADDSLDDRVASPTSPNAERELVLKRARSLLDQVLASLTDDLRDVFVLHELEELTTPEVAACLDLPVGTVASRLRRARTLFLEQVERLEKRELHRLARHG